LVAPLGVAESRILTGWGGGRPDEVVPKAAAAVCSFNDVINTPEAVFRQFFNQRK
jgi:hypothetical protein